MPGDVGTGVPKASHLGTGGGGGGDRNTYDSSGFTSDTMI